MPGKRSWWLRGFGVATFALLVATPLPVLAQGPNAGPAPAGREPNKKELDEAKERFLKGLKLYDDGAYDAARVQFERAYELAPSFKLLYNVGLVYKQLNEFVGALKAFRRYLSEGGAEIPDDRKTEVNKYIIDLQAIIASATVTTNVPGAEVSVDDALIGKTPLREPVLLNPGRRKISAKGEGLLPDAKVITVASGDQTQVALNLVSLEKPSRRIPWVGWVATGVLAIGTGIFGYLAVHESNKLSDMKGQINPQQSDLNSESKKINAYAVVADILGVGTVAAAGVSLYLTIKWGNEEPAPTKAALVPQSFIPVGFNVNARF